MTIKVKTVVVVVVVVVVTMRHYASAAYVVVVCPSVRLSVCLSQACTVYQNGYTQDHASNAVR